MLDVDFIDLTSYTYLVTGHKEVVHPQRRGFPSDHVRKVGTKGFGISMFVIIHDFITNFTNFVSSIQYCLILYIVISPYIVYQIALLMEYLLFILRVIFCETQNNLLIFMFMEYSFWRIIFDVCFRNFDNF